MTPLLAAVTPVGMLITLVIAVLVALVLGGLAGVFDKPQPKEQDVDAMSFWVPKEDGRVHGPFPAGEIEGMVRAGILGLQDWLWLSAEGPEALVQDYPRFVRAAVKQPVPAELVRSEPEQPAASKGGLGKAGGILLLIGGLLAVLDMALAGFPGLLSVGLIGVGIVLAVVGACTTPAKS